MLDHDKATVHHYAIDVVFPDRRTSWTGLILPARRAGKALRRAERALPGRRLAARLVDNGTPVQTVLRGVSV